MNEIAFTSNKLEVLAEKLYQNLFADSDLLASCYVVVENKQQKEWLQLFLAKKHKVLTLVRFIERKKLFAFLNQENGKIPTSLELNLALEQKILSILDNTNRDALYAPLVKYFTGLSFSQKKRRLNFLCNTLTPIFEDYAQIEKLQNGSWQALLFEELFAENNWQKTNIETVTPFILHLFANIHWTNWQHNLLAKIAEKTSVFHYFLSFSPLYFGDISTSHEKKAARRYWEKKRVPQKSKDALEDYGENNVLLSNMGKGAREYLRALEQKEVLIFEQYVEEEDKNLLSSIRNDLYCMNTTPQEPYINEKEKSLQIHIATSKTREVQILKEHVLQLIDSGISPAQIAILAPNIEEFAPYIEMVFTIPYKISDLSISSLSFFAKGLLQFFALLNSRLEKETLLNLFYNPSFSATFFKEKELSLIVKWLDKIFIQGDASEEKIAGILPSTLGRQTLYLQSWDEGFKRLLQIFAIPDNSALNLSSTLNSISSSQVETLEKLIRVFTAIKEDVQFLEKNPSKTLLEWSEILQEIAYNYFTISDDSSERKGKNVFEEFLGSLRKSALLFPDTLFSFEAIWRNLKKELNKKRFARNSDLIDVLQFGSFKSGAIVPKEVICLIGMNEDSFREKNSTWHLAKHSFLQESEEQRHLFLQTLLSAQKELYLSFVGFSASGQKRPAAPILEEFFSYLNSSYSSNDSTATSSLTTIHPSSPSHPSYFQGAKFTSYSLEHFAALQTQQMPKAKAISLFPTYDESTTQKPTTIDINDLYNLAKNPLKFYYNKTLQLFLQSEEEEFLKLSSLDEFLLKKEALHTDTKMLIEQLFQKGILPPGMFCEIARKKIENELSLLKQNLKKLNIDPEEIATLRLSEKAISFENNMAPPIELEVQGLKVKIIGKIDNFTTKGILTYGDSKTPNCLRCSPLLLILPHLPFCKTAMLSLKDGKATNFNLNKELLAKFVEYFWRAKQNISPFLPNLGASFFKKGPEEVSKMLQKSNNQFSPNIYLEHILQNCDQIAEDKIASWQKFLHPIFAPFLGSEE